MNYMTKKGEVIAAIDLHEKHNYSNLLLFSDLCHHEQLRQGSLNLAHEIHFPAEFSSNPNQTHLSMLISVFKIIRKSQVGEFDQGWS